MGDILAQIKQLQEELKQRFDGIADKRTILAAKEIKEITKRLADLEPSQRALAGRRINELKKELQDWVGQWQEQQNDFNAEAIDLTAPFDDNTPPALRPHLLTSDQGSEHPITAELRRIGDIFTRMGFKIEQSRQLDDDYHMFASLNFPPDHPARDDYDTFVTDEGLILPAQTSTMQNRILRSNKPPIQVIIPGRVYRNEDLDATHEHTFYQVEGLVVDVDLTLGHMIGLLQVFLDEFFQEKVEFRLQPFYFPFVEPGMEVWVKAPKSLKQSLGAEWIEIIGCGMIHPKVLQEGGIDPKKYRGFAWGGGIDRMIMARHGIEDIRYFHSGRLDFLRQFARSQL